MRRKTLKGELHVYSSMRSEAEALSEYGVVSNNVFIYEGRHAVLTR
jgi:hypothetical protein